MQPLETVEQLADGDVIVAVNSKKVRHSFDNNYNSHFPMSEKYQHLNNWIGQNLSQDIDLSFEKEIQSNIELDELQLWKIWGKVDGDGKCTGMKSPDELILESRWNLYGVEIY